MLHIQLHLVRGTPLLPFLASLERLSCRGCSMGHRLKGPQSAMSFCSFNFEATPVSPSNNLNNSVFPSPSPCTTRNIFTYSALNSNTFCFKTPLRIEKEWGLRQLTESITSTPRAIPSHSRGSKRHKETLTRINSLQKT